VPDLYARRDDAECARSRNEPGRTANGAARQSGGGNEHEHARQYQEALRGFLMPVQRASRDYALDAILLRFARFSGYPGAHRERRRDRYR